MALSAKERRDLHTATAQRLTEVIGASGKADELVKLTTQIVQAAKKLAEGTPDAIKTRSTATLAEFVIAAKKIAQDPRAVDSNSLQKLSSSKKAVEALLKELDAWHTSQNSKDDADLSLDDILNQTSRNDKRGSIGGGSIRGLGGGSSAQLGGLGSGGGSCSNGSGIKRTSPTELHPTEQEKKLMNELKRRQEELVSKTEPQSKPSHHGDPEETLKVAVRGLSLSTSQLLDLAGQKAPSKESLLEPTIILAKMVSVLMDLVDGLFVSKFPMRSQVHTFACVLVENVVSYGDQTRTEDATSLRLISTQAPALMSALEVMVEQCVKRAQNIRENQQMSMQRNLDLHDLDVFGPGQSPRSSPAATKKRKEPPTPPVKTPPAPQVQEFEVCVMICSNVAVDSTTSAVMTKGSEITIKVNSNTNVHEVRNMLAKRTSIPMEAIQLRFRGDDVLTDDTRMTPDNPVPYFMFNLQEPGEEELTEFRKEQRRKNRLRIDTKDWSRVPSPVAVAIYDYEALAEPGEEDNLEFEEGDLIEIVEQSADGWWTGKVDGKEGVFPASFVELIQKPKNKEERKKLLKLYNQGRLGEANNLAAVDLEPPARPPDPKFSPAPEHTSSNKMTKSTSFNKIFHKQHSTPSDNSDSAGSPSPTKMPAGGFGKFEKRGSESAIDVPKEREGGKHKKRLSLFKKKQPSSSSSASSFMSLTDDFQRSPILPYRNKGRDSNAAVIRELDEEMVGGGGRTPTTPTFPQPSMHAPPTTAPPATTAALEGTPPPTRSLFRPKSSPKLAQRGIGGGIVDLSKLRSPPEGGNGEQQPSKKDKPNLPLPPDAGQKARVKRRPPPPPPPYAKKYGARGMNNLVRKQSSGEDESVDGNSDLQCKTLPLTESSPVLFSVGPDKANTTSRVAMTVTPASPVLRQQPAAPPEIVAVVERSSSTASSKSSRGERDKEEEKGEETNSRSSNSMEDLLKNLEEFDEFSSTQSLTNGSLKPREKTKAERDYATIPRSELPVKLEGSSEEEEEEEEGGEGDGEEDLLRPASVPTGSSHSPPGVDERPFMTPSPLLTSSKFESSSTGKGAESPSQDNPPSEGVPAPIKPPRSRSKRMRIKKQLEEEEKEQTNGQDTAEPASEPKDQQQSQTAPPPQQPDHAPTPTSKQQQESAPKTTPIQPLPSPAAIHQSPKQGRPVFHRPKPPSMPPPPLENSKSPAGTGAQTKPKPPSEKPAPAGEKPKLPPGEKPKPPGEKPKLGEKPRGPIAPPRKNRSLKRPPKNKEAPADGGVSEKPALATKPKQIPQVARAYLQVFEKQQQQQQCSSAPVSRTASPEEGGRLKTEGSTSISNLCSSTSSPTPSPLLAGERRRGSTENLEERRSSGGKATPARRKFLSYKTAIKCIAYLSSDQLVRQNRLISSSSGKTVQIERLLTAIGNSEDVDLNSLGEAPSVLGLLLALYEPSHLGCLIEHDLAEQLCASMQSADPITVLAGKLEKLSKDYRDMLKKLLRLFGKILKYSDKNQTEVSDINKVFGPVIFENISSSQSEQLLAYLISTCEFLIT